MQRCESGCFWALARSGGIWELLVDALETGGVGNCTFRRFVVCNTLAVGMGTLNAVSAQPRVSARTSALQLGGVRPSTGRRRDRQWLGLAAHVRTQGLGGVALSPWSSQSCGKCSSRTVKQFPQALSHAHRASASCTTSAAPGEQWGSRCREGRELRTSETL